MNDGIVCYCLERDDGKRTYVGYTVNLAKRIRQHNGEIVGGAKYTSGGAWAPRWVVSGFSTKNEAMSFEWHWKRQTRKQQRQGSAPVERRRRAAEILCATARWKHTELHAISA